MPPLSFLPGRFLEKSWVQNSSIKFKTSLTQFGTSSLLKLTTKFIIKTLKSQNLVLLSVCSQGETGCYRIINCQGVHLHHWNAIAVRYLQSQWGLLTSLGSALLWSHQTADWNNMAKISNWLGYLWWLEWEGFDKESNRHICGTYLAPVPTSILHRVIETKSRQ